MKTNNQVAFKREINYPTLVKKLEKTITFWRNETQDAEIIALKLKAQIALLEQNEGEKIKKLRIQNSLTVLRIRQLESNWFVKLFKL